MRRFSVLAIAVALSACTGGGQDASDYVPPQPEPTATPSSGISVSGSVRVGVVKGG